MTITGGNMPGYHSLLPPGCFCQPHMELNHMNWKYIALEMEYLTEEERTLLNQLRISETKGVV